MGMKGEKKREEAGPSVTIGQNGRNMGWKTCTIPTYTMKQKQLTAHSTAYRSCNSARATPFGLTPNNAKYRASLQFSSTQKTVCLESLGGRSAGGRRWLRSERGETRTTSTC